jgi:hypothetical protein
VWSEREELLPEMLLHLPEVCRLAGEGGPMYLLEGRKPFPIVPFEEEVDAFVGVDAEKLPDDLDGEDFGVGELRGGTALADAASVEPIVHEAEDGHDEGALRSTREDLLYAGRFGGYRE